MRRSGWIATVNEIRMSMCPSKVSLSTMEWPVLDMLHLRRPPSRGPDRTPGRHPSRRTSRLRNGHGKPRWVGSRSIPSCFELHGMDDGNSEKLKGEGLFLIDRRGGYATTTTSTIGRITVDDAEVRSNRPTLLQ